MSANFLVDGVEGSTVDGEFKVEASVVRKLHVLIIMYTKAFNDKAMMIRRENYSLNLPVACLW